MFCPDCGSKLRTDSQKYCEECGAKLEESNINSPPTNHIESRMGLFDLERNYYILKEKYWDFGSGDILDENGKIIGKMHRKIFNIRRKIELFETDGNLVATIHQKIISARGANDLKDPKGKLIARIKKKITAVIHPKFWLEDPYGNRWFEAQGEFMGWSFKIIDLTTNKIVAEIEKADRWRDIFLGGLFDFQDTYALKILDNETDRRILVGFVLSIDNTLHDFHRGMHLPYRWGPRPFPPRRIPGRVPRGRGLPF